jgi:hypothetical protein
MWQTLSVTCRRSVFFEGTPVSSTNKTDCYETRSVRFYFNGNTSYLPTFTLNAKYFWALLIRLHVTRSLVWYVCCVDLCFSYCTFGHCVVCSASIYGFWLPLWYLQTPLTSQRATYDDRRKSYEWLKHQALKCNFISLRFYFLRNQSYLDNCADQK